jgi:hypothetical protein
MTHEITYTGIRYCPIQFILCTVLMYSSWTKNESTSFRVFYIDKVLRLNNLVNLKMEIKFR